MVREVMVLLKLLKIANLIVEKDCIACDYLQNKLDLYLLFLLNVE